MRRCWMVLVVGLLVPPLQGEMVTCRLGTPPQVPAEESGSPRPQPPIGYAPETRAAPTLDGNLLDEAWAKAYTLRLERTLEGSSPAPQPTEVRLLRDHRFLYVGMRCTEPLVEQLRAPARDHDGEIWTDDSVEIFLGLAGSGVYYHFGVNAGGSTYDAQVDAQEKDRSWNSGMRAAAKREAGEWSVEVEIPLEGRSGEGKGPTEWRANFTRNRYVTGQFEDSAWSPTYSDNSHVPEWFGPLLFKEPPAEEAVVPAGTVGRNGKPAAPRVEVLRCEGGEGVVRFDLSGLPRGARIYRADLLIFRTQKITGQDEAALVDIEIYPLFTDFTAGGQPEAGRLPLPLRPPWFERFDATEAVQQWVSGQPNGGFFVQVCPRWNAEGTCLDLAYEGPPGEVPPQVAGLKVVHRAGQTFLTWREVEPLVTTEQVTWGEMKQKLKEASRACRYRVYAHSQPINARTIAEAEWLAEVGPLSGYNANGRNVEYLIGQAMIRPDEMGELARDYNGYIYSWHTDHPRMDRYPVPRLVVDEPAGPLPVGTGLYVHHPALPGQRFYAVVSCQEGVENTRDFSPANATAEPVEETVGTGEPVCQGEGLWGPCFDYPGQRKVYVQWCAPSLSPRPNMYFNWSVLVPPGLKQPAPVELYFHSGSYSYARPLVKFLAESIQIAPHDYPFSGWYGYHDAWGTLKSYQRGVVSNHTQKRILAFLEWAKKTFPIDPERLLLVGGDGAALLALNYPETFAYVTITGFEAGVLDDERAGDYAAVWGPRSPDLQDEQGQGEWAWAELDRLVLAQPGRDLPLFVCKGPSWGRVPGYGMGRGRFYEALQQSRQPLYAHWAWGGSLAPPDRWSGLWCGIDLRRNTPLPAITRSSADAEGEGHGHTNTVYTWKEVKDEPDRFEITLLGPESTLDLTLRRVQQFQVQPGERVQWEAATPSVRHSTSPPSQTGQAVADAQGLVTLEGLKIVQNSDTLVIEVTRARGGLFMRYGNGGL